MSEVHSNRTIVTRHLVVLCLLLLGTFGQAQIVKWHVAPKYSQVRIVADNLMAVSYSGKWGLSRYDGTEVLPVEYETITTVCEDHMLALNADVLKAIVTTNGSITYVDGNYRVDRQCPYFSEGLLPVKNASGKWGYMNLSGTVVIDCQFLTAYPFAFGLAAVQYDDGYFVHINRKCQISHLGKGFRSNDILFAGTFTADDSGKEPFALVCVNGVMYKRSLDGSRLQFSLSGITRISKEISVNGCTLKFGEDYRLSEISTANAKKAYPSQLKKSPEYLISEQIPEFGSFCTRSQFQEIKALDSRMLLASKDRLYGILEFLPEQNPGLVFSDSNIEVNHHTPWPIEGRIELPSSMKDYSVDKATLFILDGKTLTINRNGKHFDFHYIPEDLSSRKSVTLYAGITSDNIEYITNRQTLNFSYKSAFSVVAPQKVSLDSLGTAKFSLIVSNDSDQYSDTCNIYIDGRLERECSFSPNQKISVPVRMKVNTLDEDMVSRTVKVEVHEKACPEYMTSKQVIFERYYSND